MWAAVQTDIECFLSILNILSTVFHFAVVRSLLKQVVSEECKTFILHFDLTVVDDFDGVKRNLQIERTFVNIRLSDNIQALLSTVLLVWIHNLAKCLF